MLQTRTQNPVIFPSVAVDRAISHARLGCGNHGFRKASRNMGDINTSVSISVAFKSATGAFEHNITGLMDIPAFTTSLAGAVWITSNNRSIILPRYLFECHSKLVMGHSLDPAVSLPMQPAFSQPIQILNGDKCVVFFGKPDNFICNFVAPSLDEVGFISFQLSELSSGLIFIPPFFDQVLKFAPSDTDIPLFLPYIPSEIELLENLSLFIEDTNRCQCPASYVDSNDGIVFSFYVEVPEDGNQELPSITIPFDSEMGCSPSICQEFIESIPCPILRDWQTNPILQSYDGNNGVAPFGFSERARTWNVKRNRSGINTISSIVFPRCKSILNCIYNELGLQSKLFSNMLIFKLMEIKSSKWQIKNIPVSQCLRKMVSCIKPILLQIGKHLLLPISQWKNIQLHGFRYLLRHDYHSNTICIKGLKGLLSIPPTTKAVGFLEVVR